MCEGVRVGGDVGACRGGCVCVGRCVCVCVCGGVRAGLRDFRPCDLFRQNAGQTSLMEQVCACVRICMFVCVQGQVHAAHAGCFPHHEVPTEHSPDQHQRAGACGRVCGGVVRGSDTFPVRDGVSAERSADSSQRVVVCVRVPVRGRCVCVCGVCVREGGVREGVCGGSVFLCLQLG